MKKKDVVQAKEDGKPVTGIWVVEDVSPDGRKVHIRAYGHPETRTWVNAEDFESVNRGGSRL